MKKPPGSCTLTTQFRSFDQTRAPSSSDAGAKKKLRLKSQLRTWLACAEFQRVVDAALDRDRTVGTLITLTYTADPLICWRAIDAIGRCAVRLSTIRPDVLKNYLRRLFWLMSDESGAVAWHAPEIIGEIVRSHPQTFADFIPMTIALLDLEPEDRPPFLSGILYSLGRIGEAAPGSVEAGLPGIVEALTEADSQARSMAVWCLGRLGVRDALFQRPELSDDQAKALVYRDEQLIETTVCSLLAEALA